MVSSPVTLDAADEPARNLFVRNPKIDPVAGDADLRCDFDAAECEFGGHFPLKRAVGRGAQALDGAFEASALCIEQELPQQPGTT